MKKFLLFSLLALVSASAAHAQPFTNTDGDETVSFTVNVVEWCWVDASPNSGSASASPDGNSSATVPFSGGSLLAGTNNDTGGCDVTAAVAHLGPTPGNVSDNLDEVTFDIAVGGPVAVVISANGDNIGTSANASFDENNLGADEVASDMLQSIATRTLDYTLVFGSTAASGNHTFNVTYQAVATP